MTESEQKEIKNPIRKQEKILLGMLPLWDRLIPPMGISCLKSFLQTQGYPVKIVDANVQEELKDQCDTYFNTLRKCLPPGKRSNFYSLTYDIFANHAMASINQQEEKDYQELIKLLVYNTFYYELEEHQVKQLNQVVLDFFEKLGAYITHLIQEENPTMLGFSVFGGTLAASLFAFRLAKQINPKIITMMGGGIFANQLALGSPNLEYFLERTEGIIDKIFIGESEKLALKYLRGEMPKAQRVYANGGLEENLLNLSYSSVPDFSDLDMSYYNNLSYYCSRGCPLSCKFCSETVLWGRYRKRDATHTVEGISRIKETHQYQLFLFNDSLLNPVLDDLSQELIQKQEYVYFDGYLKVDRAVCSTENTLLWRKGGFYRARMGIESGSQRVLDLMGKNINIKQIKSSVSALAESGIKTTTYWVIGFPGETEEDFLQTLQLIEDLKDDIYEADCNPFWYFLTGQPESDGWASKNKSELLYPKKYKEMLIVQTWILKEEPSREIIYDRINRFVAHCKKVGVPNPYSISEIYEADKRWKRLHKNAAPMLVEFERNGRCLKESRDVKPLQEVQNTVLEDNGDFEF
jgi:radical SAM superfamily enzyme YgiQ (UPF0313 family)